MEPSTTRLRAATAWATGTAGGTAATGSGTTSGSSLHARAALQFAEKRQYRELLHAIQLRPELAAASDPFGMTPLHWLCTDRSVPLRALQQLVLAYPTATTVRNLAGLLPVHMAVRKDLSLDALKTVLKFYPKAVVAETPDGATPVRLAQDHVTSRTTRHFLQQLEQEVRALGRVPPPSSSSETLTSTSTGGRDPSQKATTTEWQDGYPVAIVDASVTGSQPSASQRSLDDRALDGMGTRPLPPVWKLNTRCYVCETKFGYFKKRHHCRNCGESVCGRHSRHSVPLKHLGLFHAQRVCSGCYGRLQSHYTSRAIARLSPLSASARTGRQANGEDVMREDLLPRTNYLPSPPHPRQTRSRSAHSMTFAHQAQQHPLLSPRHHHMQTPSPLVITPPPSTRTTRSATLSPRSTASCRTASSNTIRSGNSTTASSKYQPNFIKMPSGMSMHITHVQRTDDQLTVLDRQREMQRRRDRLANTDLETYAWQGRDSETSSPVNNQNQDDDDELLMEMQMEKLLLAKKQIRDALQRSKRDADHAQAEKDKYNELAKEYEQRGYAYSSESLDKEGTDANGTFVDSESGVDDTGSATSSVAAAKYGYATCDDNQREHEGDDSSVIVHGSAFTDPETDDNDSAVYGLVPETTPGDVAHDALPPQFDDLDMPLDRAATYHDLGEVLLSKGDFVGAAIELQKSLDLNSNNAQAWYHFAKALDGKGESDAAETAIHKSLGIEPNSLPSLSLLGKLLNARGEHDEAIVVFRRALNLQCPSDS